MIMSRSMVPVWMWKIFLASLGLRVVSFKFSSGSSLHFSRQVVSWGNFGDFLIFLESVRIFETKTNKESIKFMFFFHFLESSATSSSVLLML